MIGIRRRKLLIGCVCCNASRITFAALPASGCLLTSGQLELHGVRQADFGAIGDGEGAPSSSGDPQLDRYLGRALARVALVFGVAPSFAFYTDGQKPNAKASPDTMTSGTWGSIIFGRSLFLDQFSRYKDNGVSVLAILAHEFAHVRQYRTNIVDELAQGESSVRRIELHADFLSGWYLGLRKRADPTISLWASGDTFRRIGDYEYNNPSHHGTPEQRVAASKAGFDSVEDNVTNIDDASNVGKAYIKRLVLN